VRSSNGWQIYPLGRGKISDDSKLEGMDSSIGGRRHVESLKTEIEHQVQGVLDFHEPEFRSLPKHSEQGNELRNLLNQAIEKIPTAKPFLIKGDSAQNR
jgi:hypothetical protein